MDEKILNIRFKNEGLERKLSNLYPYTFIIDECEMESMEGFIQSLRTSDLLLKKNLWNKSGYNAWKLGQNINWTDKQELYWITTPINRHSDEYINLFNKAYDCLFEQNEEFKNNLKESIPYKLEHTIGTSNINKTLMTRLEFLNQLNRLRNKLTERKYYNLFEI